MTKFLHSKRIVRKETPVKVKRHLSAEFLRTPFLQNSSRRLFLTLQVHKSDKNVPRYCNKDIKVISFEAILVTLCQL